MATIIIRKELKDFLKKEGILGTFIENVKKEKVHAGCEQIIINGINTAFRWRLTEKKGEGANYWSKINIKWNTYRRENGITN